MAQVEGNFSLGPGLTFQRGPFKYNKNKRAPVQTIPWKGGGVPAGGQQHAGHGNWEQWMNPQGTPQHFPSPPLPLATPFDRIVVPPAVQAREDLRNHKPSAGRRIKRRVARIPLAAEPLGPPKVGLTVGTQTDSGAGPDEPYDDYRGEGGPSSTFQPENEETGNTQQNFFQQAQPSIKSDGSTSSLMSVQSEGRAPSDFGTSMEGIVYNSHAAAYLAHRPEVEPQDEPMGEYGRLKKTTSRPGRVFSLSYPHYHSQALDIIDAYESNRYASSSGPFSMKNIDFGEYKRRAAEIKSNYHRQVNDDIMDEEMVTFKSRKELAAELSRLNTSFGPRAPAHLSNQVKEMEDLSYGGPPHSPLAQEDEEHYNPNGTKKRPLLFRKNLIQQNEQTAKVELKMNINSETLGGGLKSPEDIISPSTGISRPKKRTEARAERVKRVVNRNHGPKAEHEARVAKQRDAFYNKKEKRAAEAFKRRKASAAAKLSKKGGGNPYTGPI